MQVTVTLRQGSDRYGSDKPKVRIFKDVTSVGYNSSLYSIHLKDVTVRIPLELIEDVYERRVTLK
jgi:hypothetical protein